MKHATRIALTLMAVIALLLAGFAPAQAKQADVKHYKAAAAVTFHKASVAKPRAIVGSNAYGWNWDHPVSVCDQTGNPRWDVDGAIDKWSVQGLSLFASCSNPDITITQGDATALCTGSVRGQIIGCADTTVVNGEPVHGTIVMESVFADWVYIDTLVGGALHEVGHTVGFGHAPIPNSDSVMGVPIPANGGARTTLSHYDRGGVRVTY